MSVDCRRVHWAGVHLTLSHTQSKLHNLYLEAVGYAYRDDIRIPGSGLRIDNNIHDIAGLKIVGSSGIGIVVLYNNPLPHKFVIQNLSIVNTASRGFRFLSPFMTLSHVNVSGSRGKEILYESINWGHLNAHTSDMASPEMRKVLPICLQNNTFLEPEKRFYFVFKNDFSAKKSCDLVFSTELGYMILIQIIYHTIQSYQSFQIFDGPNGTAQERIWEVRNLHWPDRPVINSTTNHFYGER